jgi:hypothetical protein
VALHKFLPLLSLDWNSGQQARASAKASFVDILGACFEATVSWAVKEKRNKSLNNVPILA